MKKIVCVLLVVMSLALLVSCNKDETSEHKHELVSVAAKLPTCAENGYTSFEKCNSCDYSTKRDVLANGFHKFGDGGICETCGINKDNAPELREEKTYHTYEEFGIFGYNMSISVERPLDGICKNGVNYYISYYNSDGQCVGTTWFTLLGEETSSSEYYYDTKGEKAIEKPKSSGSVVSYSEITKITSDNGEYTEIDLQYDENGEALCENSTTYYSNGARLEKQTDLKDIQDEIRGFYIYKAGCYTIYEYDENGRLISYTEGNIDGEVYIQVEQSYEKDGTLANASYIDSDGSTETLEREYHETGKVAVEYLKKNGVIYEKTEYDSFGNKIRFYQSKDLILTAEHENEYNDQGELVEVISKYYRNSGEEIVKSVYEREYDGNGKLVKDKVTYYSFENGEWIFNNYKEYRGDGSVAYQNLHTSFEGYQTNYPWLAIPTDTPIKTLE